MALLLQQAWHSPYAAELTSSLPLVAMDGTMRRRLRGTELRGEGRIKTGSLNSVRAIAGYARDEQNTTWAVVGIVNHPQAGRLQSALDAVLQQVRIAPRNPSIATAAR
jgi:D-alanyl-D-alanine carboxypeptidase/D-alanyl-D-alanine-endopeptidase (penicillin-binding protein 4)